MSEFPTRDDFFNQLNTKFRAYLDAEKTTDIELTEVTELRERPRNVAYSITFLAPNDTPPEQRLYKIEHDSLGTMEIFLVPVDRDEKGLFFEAVFNHKLTALGG